MQKFIDWLQTFLVPKMKKISENVWVSALSSAMLKSIPFIYVGSICYFYDVFVGWFPWLPSIGSVAMYSFGLLGLIVAYFVGEQTMLKFGNNEYPSVCGITSVLMMFMFVLEGTAPYNRLGPSAILVAIISGVYTTLFFNAYKRISPFKNSTMPDFVINWFNVVIPVFFALLVGQILTQTLHLDLFTLCLNMFNPIAQFAQTLPGMIIFCLLYCVFYSCGISTWMFSPLKTSIDMIAITANIDNVAKGLKATNYLTNEALFASGLIMMGGIGATLALNLLMLFSKSKKLRTLGKIFIGPSIFNINEPIVYGTVVMNPLLMIPLWMTGIIGPIMLWLVFDLGLLKVPAALMQVNSIPIGIGTVMATQDWRGVIWAVVFLAVYMLIYYPFFKVYEKEMLASEIEETE